MRTKRLLLAIFAVGTVRAQISGPVAGFVFDLPARSIRPVIGVIGSATLGAPLVRALEFASIAPHQNYAIAVRRGAVLFVSGLGAADVVESALTGASGVPDGVCWSDDGSFAILYSRSSNWLQVFTGFPDSIQAASQISAPGSLLAVATDSHGQHIAVSLSGDQPGVYQLGGGQISTPLFGSTAAIGLTFSPDGSVLYALDSSTNQITEFNFMNSALQTMPAPVDDAMAIRATVDRSGTSVLYVAGGSSHSLVSLNPVTYQPIASASLTFPPTMIEPLGPTSFVLNQRADQANTVWTFINNPQPVVYFVPSTPNQLPRQGVPR